MRKSAILLLCLTICSCKSRQADVSAQTDGKSGSVTAAAGRPAGGGKLLGNDNPPTLFPVRVDGKYGYMDKKGKLVVKAAVFRRIAVLRRTGGGAVRKSGAGGVH